MTTKPKSSYFRRDDSKAAPAAAVETQSAPERAPRAPRADKPRFDKPTTERKFDRGDKPKFERGDKPKFERGDKPKFDRPNTDRKFDRGDKPKFERGDKPRFERGDKPKFERRDAKPTTTNHKSRFADNTPITERVERPERTVRGNKSFSPRVEKPSKSASAPKKAAEMPVELRLNRFIAQSGVCSRREADELIRNGEIRVNGEVVTELGVKVNSTTDKITYQDKVLSGEKLVYILMNKPKGYVTTTDDPHAEQTVIDLLKGKVRERIYPIGRLDKNTTGVLLLTNDGDLTRELTHPSFEKRKIYHVFLDKPVAEEHLEALARGVELEDGTMSADQISYVEGNRKEVGVEIHSGRNRIVRRMFEHFEYKVVKLDRVYFAGFTKEGLRRGFWRLLTDREVAMLKGGSYR